MHEASEKERAHVRGEREVLPKMAGGLVLEMPN